MAITLRLVKGETLTFEELDDNFIFLDNDKVSTDRTGSFATTGSNVFTGNQTFSGSLTVTGSNTFIGNQIISGTVSASFFTGDGSGLTNLPGGGGSGVGFPFFGAAVITGSLLVSGSANSFIVGNVLSEILLITSSVTLEINAGSKYIRALSSSDLVLTVPSSSVVNFPIGTSIVIEQTGTGTVFVEGTGSVVLNTYDGLSTDGLYSIMVLQKVLQDEWTVVTGETPFTGSFLGTFSGSFLGDGSGLTGLPATPPFPFSGSATITGSLAVTGSITGNVLSEVLLITSSVTLELNAGSKYIRALSSSDLILTVPSSSVVNFPIGTSIAIEQAGTGTVFVEGTGSVVLNSYDGVSTDGLHSIMVLQKILEDEWTVVAGETPFTGSFLGTFSGSFVGDGSGLTGLPATPVFPFSGSAEITGSLIVTGSITGNVLSEVLLITGSTSFGLNAGSKYIRALSSSDLILTVPSSSVVNFPIGTSIAIEQAGTGTVFVESTGNVVLNSYDGLSTDGLYSIIVLQKVLQDEWTVVAGETPFTGSFLGTFSGSFLGDGSGLTGLPVTPPFPFSGSAEITGSLIVTGSITGNVLSEVLLITSSVTLELNAGSKYIRALSSSDLILTVPSSSVVNFPIGTSIAIEQAGTGNVFVGSTGNVVLNAYDGVGTDGLHSIIILQKVLEDEWTVVTGETPFTGSFLGTFSGSFVGDGSGLTGLVASDVFPFSGSAEITGSLIVTGSITGNVLSEVLLITSSTVLQINAGSKYIRALSSSDLILTVPSSSVVNFPIGTSIAIEQAGTGTVFVEGTGNVVLNAYDGVGTEGLHSIMVLQKVLQDQWTVVAGETPFTGSFLGTFSGSFVGDGSGLTGLVASDVFPFSGSATITGSLAVTGSITGNVLSEVLLITSSTALEINAGSKYIRALSSSDLILTVPSSSVVNFPIGTSIAIEQAGTGNVFVEGTGNVLLNAYDGVVSTDGLHSIMVLQKVLQDEWTVVAGETPFTGSFLGTFSGSFVGDGSGLTNLPGGGGGGGSTPTGSLLVTASAAGNTITFTKGDASTFDVTVSGGGGGSTPTGSLLVTASAAGNTITFTKGDASTFAVTVSGTAVDTGSFTTTSSFGTYTGSANTRLSSLEAASGSIRTDFSTYTGSANTRLSSLEAATGSLSASFEGLNTFSASQKTLNTTFTTTASFTAFTSSYTTGSFTGSFVGDGSGLTNLPGGGGGGAGFPFSGSAVITGSLLVSGSADSFIEGNLLSSILLITSSTTLGINAASKYVRVSGSSDITLTVPSSSVVNFPIGTSISIEQSGDGLVYAEGSGNVVLNAFDGVSTDGPYTIMFLHKVFQDEWTVVTGDSALTGSFLGTFSGSFEGDGSGLTGVIVPPFPFAGSAVITGSLLVTDSLLVSGSLTVTGSLLVSGSVDSFIEGNILSPILLITSSTTLGINAASKYVRVSGSSDITLTVPASSSVNFPTGTSIAVEQTGTGTVTFIAGSTVVLNAKDGLSSDGQFSIMVAQKVLSNTWTVIGGVP